jgi:signal peptidase I
MNPSIWKHAGRLLRELVVALIFAAVIIFFVYQPVKVEGTSMMPGLVDAEQIFINKFVYRLGMGGVQRGDTVVFFFPQDPRRSYIKRVIGIPGDTVEIREGRVWLNGSELNEPYVPEEYRDPSSMAPFRVPAGHYFVMGDHRSASNDSRAWGPVPMQSIYGKAVFIYWPLERIGTVR